MQNFAPKNLSTLKLFLNLLLNIQIINCQSTSAYHASSSMSTLILFELVSTSSSWTRCISMKILQLVQFLQSGPNCAESANHRRIGEKYTRFFSSELFIALAMSLIDDPVSIPSSLSSCGMRFPKMRSFSLSGRPFSLSAHSRSKQRRNSRTLLVYWALAAKLLIY